MTGEPEIPRDADRAGDGEPVPGRRVWRWAAPIGVAVIVVAAVAGVRLMADGPHRAPSARHGGEPYGQAGEPRFLLTAGSSGDASRQGRSPQDDEPWFQVHGVAKTGTQRLIDSVAPPSSSAGRVREIVAGPGGTFVIAAWARPCQSRLYRFRLTADGHATDITPVAGGVTPAAVAGLALSPDGRRIAYATAACAADPSTPSKGTPPAADMPPRIADPPAATLTVLDIATGTRRTWTTGPTSIIGEIIWARDSRTLGYAISDLVNQTPTSPPDWPGMPPEVTVGNVTVYALDVDAPGTDLLGRRVLFHQPAGSGTVTFAIMNPDGRTGYGAMRKGKPPSTLLFSFAEGQPMRVTYTMPPEPDGVLSAMSISTDDGPRYACLTGIDAFGRAIDGTFRGGMASFGQCTAAYFPPS